MNINTTTGSAFAGSAGVLEMTQLGTGKTAATNGAVTNNSFSWSNDARTLTFWWKASNPGESTRRAELMCRSVIPLATARGFDVKGAASGTNAADLRVEVQGTGFNTSPANFDDGSWQFVAVTVPDNATFQDIAWYVNGSGTDLHECQHQHAGRRHRHESAGLWDSIVLGLSVRSTTGRRTATSTTSNFTTKCSLLEQIAFLSTTRQRDRPCAAGIRGLCLRPVLASRLAISFEDDPDGDKLANRPRSMVRHPSRRASCRAANLSTDGITTTFTTRRTRLDQPMSSASISGRRNLVDWYDGDGSTAHRGLDGALFNQHFGPVDHGHGHGERADRAASACRASAREIP